MTVPDAQRAASLSPFGIDVANTKKGNLERLVPETTTGDLAEAEHFNRYWWADAFVPSGEVLDAGCGVGYGSVILAREGHRRVVGVDSVGAVLDAMKPMMPADVTLQQADLHALPFEDDRFDAVVCFEVLEHVRDPMRALNELRRVLKPDGLLVVSVPSGATEPPGNAHYLQRFDGDQLKAALIAMFPNVDLRYQSSWIASAILSAEEFEREGSHLPNPTAHKVIKVDPQRCGTLLAIATAGALSVPPPSIALTHNVELQRWLTLWNEQERGLKEQLAHVVRLEREAEEVRQLQVRLLEAEQLIASVPQLQKAVQRLADERAALQQRIAGLLSSTSWRVTAPMRFVSTRVRLGLRRQVEAGFEDFVDFVRRRFGLSTDFVDFIKRRFGR